jgi:hypothetical protein
MLAGLDSDHVAAVHTNSDPLGALDYLPEGAARSPVSRKPTGRP